MNQVTHHDFGLFETESLSVDFISLNLASSLDLSQVASYFQAFGFNCYQKVRQENKSRKEVNNKNKFQNKYELTFITDIPYWDGIQVHFAGFHANSFYKLIKGGQNLNQFHAILSRIDVYYDRKKQSKDKIHSQEFINSYPTTLNGKLKRRIKEHFIQYLQLLENQRKIRPKVLILPSNQIYQINQLTYRDLYKNKTIVAFEIIDIKFI